MLQPCANRLAAAGVVASFDALARTVLTRRGVPDDAIITIAGQWRGPWQESQRLGDWLRPRPDVQVVVFADRLSTARQRWILDHALEPDLAARIAVQPLARSEFDETNWWKSRFGVKTFMSSALSWCYLRSQHRPEEIAQPWDPQAYRRWLAEGAAATVHGDCPNFRGGEGRDPRKGAIRREMSQSPAACERLPAGAVP